MSSFTFDVELRLLDTRLGKSIPLPDYATIGSAAIDLVACLKTDHIFLKPQEVAIIPSGIAVHISNRNYAMFLLPRSGLGIKSGVVLANLVGLIDSDYQGEIQVALWNRGSEPFTVNLGDRICQAYFAPVAHPKFIIVDNFSQNTVRGSNGLGSSGI